MHMLVTYTHLKMPHSFILLFKTNELNPKMRFNAETSKKEYLWFQSKCEVCHPRNDFVQELALTAEVNGLVT